MNHYPIYPACLNQGEFTVTRFVLDMVTGCRLEPGTLLSLCRLLRLAAAEVLGEGADALFDTPLSNDQWSLRRHQKPAPGFVLHVSHHELGPLLEGDRLQFEFLLLGSAAQSIGDLVAIIRQLGIQGLAHGEGCFEIAEISILSSAGAWQRLGSAALRGSGVTPQLIRLDHWLDDCWPPRVPVLLEFDTPLRLVTAGRVLRRPRFGQLFPFLLRRVTSMLHTYCLLEAVDDPAPLLQAARGCRSSWNSIGWLDWRETDRQERVGGLLGTLRIDGPELDAILWVLLLATLFGVGKGAAYGAGHCRLQVAE
jgi:hypothetical protein